MASIITMKCLKTIIRNKNVVNLYMIIIFFIKYMLYKKAHDRTISIVLNVIFLKVRCANSDASPISQPLPYMKSFENNIIFCSGIACSQYVLNTPPPRIWLYSVESKNF